MIATRGFNVDVSIVNHNERLYYLEEAFGPRLATDIDIPPSKAGGLIGPISVQRVPNGQRHLCTSHVQCASPCVRLLYSSTNIQM